MLLEHPGTRTPAGAAWQPSPRFESRACVCGDLGSRSLCVCGTLDLVSQEDEMCKGRTGDKNSTDGADARPYRKHLEGQRCSAEMLR